MQPLTTNSIELDHDLAAGVSGEQFRDLMSQVCGPVVVVTTVWRGQPVGTTVSAFMSLSLQPPMVLLALDRSSRLLDKVLESREFGVNVLGADQQDLARIFASKSDDKFAGVAWSARHSVPRLHGALGWAHCRVTRTAPGGDHVIIVGTVTDIDHAEGAPLVFGCRTFAAHTALSQS
jgi:flavin reductase (DIM6/NTAB) family NADH-FMN oxidoreductase RutF